MKKILLLLAFFAMIFQVSSAQILNVKWPSGHYRATLSGVDFDLYMFDSQRYQLVLGEEANKFTISGPFTIKNDTLHFATDQSFDAFIAEQKNGSSAATQIKVIAENYDEEYIQLMIGNSYEKQKLQPLKNFEHKDSIYSFSQKINPGDKLFILSSYLTNSVYAYGYDLNPSISTVYISYNPAYSLVAFNDLIAYKGNERNEIVLTDKKSPLSFFYQGDISEQDKAREIEPLPSVSQKGYTYLPRTSIFKDTTFKSYYDYNYPDTTAVNYDEKRDTVTVFTNYKEALDSAKKDNKFLVMYAEPKECKDCMVTLKEALKQANSYYSYNYSSDTFSKDFVLYAVPENDQKRLFNYGVKKIPAMVILNNNEELLSYSYGIRNNLMFENVFGYYSDYAQQLKIHQNNTVLPQKVERENYSEKALEDYLNESMKIKFLTSAYVTAPAIIDEETEVKEIDTENYTSPLKLTLDTTTVVKYLDLLISKYKIDQQPDTATANLIVKVMTGTDENFCPLMSSRYIQTMDGQLQIAPAMQYLLKNYSELSKYLYQRSDYYYYGYGDGSSLYELIADRISRTLSSAETPEAQLTALKFQDEFIKKTPEIAHFEMPLLINNLNYYAPKLNLQPFFEEVAISYCDKLAGNPLTVKTIVDSVYTNLTTFQGKSFSYASSTNHYAILGEYCNTESTDISCFYAITAATLNTAAWNFYENKVNEDLLKKALNWSKSSLLLEKDNPYYIDTYAHLLYRLGNKSEALKQQQLAVTKASAKKPVVYVDPDIFNNMKKDLQKMKAGTL